jgi:predicted transcriptional regulator
MILLNRKDVGCVILLIGKRRDRLEVIEDILKVANNPNGANKTKLVYMSNLNFNRLSAFLGFLLEKELLEKNGDENIYIITNKGREFLRQLDKMGKML